MFAYKKFKKDNTFFFNFKIHSTSSALAKISNLSKK